MEKMQAIVFDAPGAPEVMHLGEIPKPEPGPNDVLIEVAYAGVNRPDLLQREGAYPPPPGASPHLGLEVSGRIAACGEACERFALGDLVCALTPGGGYAEYVLCDEGSVMAVPDGISLREAAALPETTLTVWHNVFQRGGLQGGEKLLVHGGSSGIGSTAIQLAAARGAWVATTVGTEAKAALCRELGANLVINHREEDFVTQIKMATEKRGVDVILDMVGGDYVGKNYVVAAEDGRIVQIAFLAGSKTEVDFTRLMIKRLTHTGSTLRPRSNQFKAALCREVESEVWPLVSAGRYRPRIHETFPLRDAAAAHQALAEGSVLGKVILQVGGESTS